MTPLRPDQTGNTGEDQTPEENTNEADSDQVGSPVRHKIVYSYDKVTHEYLGEIYADIDHVDGSVLLPAYASEVKPAIPSKNNFKMVFESGAWVEKVDKRGSEYWLADGTHAVISELGVRRPQGSLTSKPDVRTLAETKAQAIKKINRLYKSTLTSLNEFSTPEERETWVVRAEACRAKVSDTLAPDADQLEMLQTEATLQGLSVGQVARRFLRRYRRYQKAIGLCEGLKEKGKSKINRCTTKEDVATKLSEVIAEFEEKTAAFTS